MQYNPVLVEAFVRSAYIYARDNSTTAYAVLEQVLQSKFRWEVLNGRTVLSLSEGGSSTAWTIPEGLSPSDLMFLAHQGILWLEQTQDDPQAATLDLSPMRRVSRLRASFRKAQV